MLELDYNFLKKFCDAEKNDELEMGTDSPYLALSEENLEDFILTEKRDEWIAIRSGDCTDTFTTNATGNFFPRMCCNTHNKHNKRKPGLFREEVNCTEM